MITVKELMEKAIEELKEEAEPQEVGTVELGELWVRADEIACNSGGTIDRPDFKEFKAEAEKKYKLKEYKAWQITL